MLKKYRIPWGLYENYPDIKKVGYVEVEAEDEIMAIEKATEWLFSNIGVGEPECIKCIKEEETNVRET